MTWHPVICDWCGLLQRGNNLPPIVTHNVVNDGDDPVLEACRRCHLFNTPHDRVKVMFPKFPIMFPHLEGLLLVWCSVSVLVWLVCRPERCGVLFCHAQRSRFYSSRIPLKIRYFWFCSSDHNADKQAGSAVLSMQFCIFFNILAPNSMAFYLTLHEVDWHGSLL